MAASRSLNKVMLIGNLSRDPVIKSTASGATVCTFGIATNTNWKDESGELQERTEFHNLVSWNKLAEICAQILAVGMLVYVDGEIRTRNWDDENGVRHYRSEVRISDMKLLDSKGKSGHFITMHPFFPFLYRGITGQVLHNLGFILLISQE